MAAEQPRFGEQTTLAIENFPGHGRLVSDVPAFVRAYAQVKAACAGANVELGVLDAARGAAIEAAALRIASLDHLDLFPVPLVQGGGGTSSNMNMNEAVASLAATLVRNGNGVDGPLEVHPNDHVNASQSTNDTYPTAMALTLMDVGRKTVAALETVEELLLGQAARGRGVRRLGRTCLQDAVTLTVEETHRGQAAIVGDARQTLEAALRALGEVPLGGTVLGTGIGAPAGFGPAAVGRLAQDTGLDLTPAANPFAAMAHLASYVALADACKQAALALTRIATDLRWLSAGPAGGPGEILLPTLQAGSSIMPGKVNPVAPELVMQLGFRVRGAAHAVDLAAAAGELELNVMEPVVLDSLLTCLDDVHAAADVLAHKCIHGLVWNQDAVERSLAGALDDFVDLARRIGYTPASQRVAARDDRRATSNGISDTTPNPATMRSTHDAS